MSALFPFFHFSQASLVPAFVLTVVAIVLSMKLATYAHCNTTLRREARARAVEAAAASLPVPSTPQNPTYITYPSSRPGSGTNSRHVSVTGHISRASLAPRSMLAPVGVLATAATATATATGWQDASTLRSSATDPSPFMASGLSRSGSISRRHAAGLAVGDITYPGNLTVGDLGYFLAAPTLTYQLNFPRLRQRRWRLLSRWLVLAVLTAIAMSFMQVRYTLHHAMLDRCLDESFCVLQASWTYVGFRKALGHNRTSQHPFVKMLPIQ